MKKEAVKADSPALTVSYMPFFASQVIRFCISLITVQDLNENLLLKGQSLSITYYYYYYYGQPPYSSISQLVGSNAFK